MGWRLMAGQEKILKFNGENEKPDGSVLLEIENILSRLYQF